MATLLITERLKRKRLSSVLGLTIDGARMDGVVLRRTNGSVSVARIVNHSLSLNPLTTAPELAGREIRNVLDAAGIHERKCVVGVPINWVLTATVDLPDLPEVDMASLLQVEAERAFPCDVSTLHIATLRSAGKQAGSRALMVGIPIANLEALASALRAAKLQPVSFSLAISALQQPSLESSRGVIALSIGENSVGLQVTSGRGLVSLRALEGALELEGGHRVLRTEVIARETRISLGQLPADDRGDIRAIRIFGPGDLAQQLADELELKFEALQLQTEVATRPQKREFGLLVPTEVPLTGAFSLAAATLAGTRTELEFLPARVSSLQRMARRYASGRLRLALAAVIALLIVPTGMFSFQQWQLMRLESEWRQISGTVQELEAVQVQIRRFRPWYDESFHSLNVLKQVTLAFPAEGIVSARSIEIRSPDLVTCSGQARDSQSLLTTIGRLRASKSVSDLKVSQIRGRSPTQFTFDFRWNEGSQ